ncbi:hypothetical protein [Humibacillus xanthopallidus]|uniref:hypothetical protein n=1 Tax=Humibacillus xanthopallidus TaxID=412689 RepID=UPI00384ED01B
MTIVTARPVRVTDHDAVDARWEVTVLKQPGGFAEVTRSADAVVVCVGDHEGSGGEDDRHAPDGHGPCCTTVRCGGGGRVIVTALAAPPVLLVGSTRTVLVPSTPSEAGTAVVEPGERLLVLSAAAFDTLPPALVSVLRELPHRVLNTSPVSVLETVFSEIPIGCGALISPVHLDTPSSRTEFS